MLSQIFNIKNYAGIFHVAKRSSKIESLFPSSSLRKFADFNEKLWSAGPLVATGKSADGEEARNIIVTGKCNSAVAAKNLGFSLAQSRIRNAVTRPLLYDAAHLFVAFHWFEANCFDF